MVLEREFGFAYRSKSKVWVEDFNSPLIGLQFNTSSKKIGQLRHDLINKMVRLNWYVFDFRRYYGGSHGGMAE
jgi:hypothetical protein